MPAGRLCAAFGFDFLGRGRDRFVAGAADDLADVAFDAGLGLEFGLGIGTGGWSRWRRDVGVAPPG